MATKKKPKFAKLMMFRSDGLTFSCHVFMKDAMKDLCKAAKNRWSFSWSPKAKVEEKHRAVNYKEFRKLISLSGDDL